MRGPQLRDARGRFMAAAAIPTGSTQAPAIKLKVGGLKLHRKRVDRAVQNATASTMPQAGQMVRRIARKSIKRRKTLRSKPGQAPFTRRGGLTRAIRYDLGPAKQSVAIGPAREAAGRLWRVLEFGGNPIPPKVPAFTPAAVGTYGPIRTNKAGKPIRAKIRTPAQANRANRLITDQIADRVARNAKLAKVNQAPRPFMRPALLTARPQLPKLWRNTVTA
jgi:hypothetical protein